MEGDDSVAAAGQLTVMLPKGQYNAPSPVIGSVMETHTWFTICVSQRMILSSLVFSISAVMEHSPRVLPSLSLARAALTSAGETEVVSSGMGGCCRSSQQQRQLASD